MLLNAGFESVKCVYSYLKYSVIVGIYSTEEKAREAVQSHKNLEGFKEFPIDCFEIHE